MSEPRPQLEAWVAALGRALAARDSAAAAGLFTETCYWRDLLTFTWNITTSEGRPAIQAMLDARLSDTAPSHFAVTDDATEDKGVVTGWFTFETLQARGVGFVRLRDGLAWTLLTSMEELKGHEEKKGRRRAFGAEHGVHQGRSTWLERRLEEEETLGFSRAALYGHRRRRPGRIGAGRAAAAARRPHDHRREEPTRGRQLAQPLQVAVSA